MITWINNAKGLGILFIVYGHSLVPIVIYQFFYYFHIPLFYFISGYLLKIKQVSVVDFTKNKFIAYMIPYYIYGLISTILYLFYLAYNSNLNKVSIINSFQGLVTGQIDFLTNSNLWFLPSLFFTVIIGSIIIGFLKQFKSIILTIFIISIILVLMGLLTNYSNSFMSLATIPTALLFFLIGNFYKIIESEYIPSFSFLLFILLFIVSMYYLSYFAFEQVVDIGHNRYRPSIVLMIFNALIGISGVVLLSKYIMHSVILEYIGKLSLYIFILHQLFTPLIDKIYSMLVIDHIWLLTGTLKIIFSLMTYELIIKHVELKIKNLRVKNDY